MNFWNASFIRVWTCSQDAICNSKTNHYAIGMFTLVANGRPIQEWAVWIWCKVCHSIVMLCMVKPIQLGTLLQIFQIISKLCLASVWTGAFDSNVGITESKNRNSSIQVAAVQTLERKQPFLKKMHFSKFSSHVSFASVSVICPWKTSPILTCTRTQKL